MKRLPALDEDRRSIAEWFERWAELVANVDFRRVREIFVEDAVAFGSKVEMVTTREALEVEQWRPVWPTMADYRYDLSTLEVILSPDRLMAVGAAVNDMREAQSLMMPLMMTMIVPWLLWMPILRDPSSTLAVVVSMVPPFSSFGMLLRLASTSPPPAWQVWLSIGLGIAGVFGAVWVTAKVFRIGILMFGKPPDLKTLVRWLRAA